MGNDNSKDLLNCEGKRVVWAWQSNTGQDPWLIPEDQIEWTPYAEEQAIIIERAYLGKKGVADLGEYSVLISSMIQHRKDDTNKQRRVMRKITDEPFRYERFSNEPSQPKSINNPFGTLNDFTEFLMVVHSKCRTFKALEFDELDVFGVLFYIFDQRTKKKNNDQFDKERKDLQKAICEGILKEGQILGTRANQEAKIFSKEITEEIENAPRLQTNNCLYRRLMKMYTEQKFLFKRVNNLLREEKWKELSNLAPYIFYLAKAFQAKTLAPTPEDIKTWGYLYRGLTLSKESLFFYEPSRNKYFSWYAFTSTSKSPAVAEKFKSKVPDPEKIEVLFTFDICDCCPSQLANVSGVSAYPREEEVLIAPATIFQIISKEVKDGKYYIQIKVLPPNDIQERMEQGDFTFEGLRAKHLEELKAQIVNKEQNFEICYQNEVSIKETISVLANAQNITSLTLRDSVFQKFGLVELCGVLQEKKLKFLGLFATTIKSEAVLWLPKKPFKDLRCLQITSSALEGPVIPKIFNSLCGTSLRGLSFRGLAFEPGELIPCFPFLSSSNIIYLEFIECTFPSDDLEDLEKTILQMQLQFLKFDCLECKSQGNEILKIFSRIIHQMSVLKKLVFKTTDEIKEATYQAFLQCLPETNLTSLTLYGDIDEERGSLLGDALDKSKIVEVCLSSTRMPEAKLLEMIVSRTRINISLSEEFFSQEQNDFRRIIQLLCKYKIYSFKFEAEELPLQPIRELISKLPETHLLSLYLPQKIKKEKGVIQQICNLGTDGNYEFAEIMDSLKRVRENSHIKEICLPRCPKKLQFSVYLFLSKHKLKEVERDEFLKSVYI